MQPEDQQWAAATLVLLSGIMGAEQFVEDRLKEFGMINVMENKVLGPIMRQQFEQGLEVGMERGIERGMERGIEQGMERGIERGMEQGRSLAQQLLQQLITEKFGHPPAWAINRIHSASLQDLQHWTSRILRATTLDDTLRADGSE
jgi:flagellar biosynthesis/type III secretory pathway protein FliH